jgi:hypothetical protein
VKRLRKVHPAWLAIIAIALGTVAYWGYSVYEAFQDHIGRDVASHHFLPAAAHHIYFRESFGYHCYVFDVPETAFRAWVDEHHFSDAKDALHSDYDHVSYRIDHDLRIEADIEDVIFIERRSDSGSGYTVRYDRKNQRAYYDWSMN